MGNNVRTEKTADEPYFTFVSLPSGIALIQAFPSHFFPFRALARPDVCVLAAVPPHIPCTYRLHTRSASAVTSADLGLILFPPAEHHKACRNTASNPGNF